jgi:two-component system CheB/CheR fusion protein
VSNHTREDKLRTRAEGLLIDRDTVQPEDANEFEARRLVHELRVHQIELELQNEQLRDSRVELEQSLARYTELFDFAPIGYATLDASGIIRSLNHAGAELLQAERSRVIGRPFSSFVAKSDEGRYLDLLQRVRTSERQVKAEVELARLRPSKFVRLTAGVPQSTDFALLLAFTDITERRRYEAELERSEEALRMVDRHKNEFMATLSHELRNPLAPIRNCIFLLEQGELADTDRRTLAVMERQVTHLSRLVDDLLDVTRIQRGKVLLKTEPLELDALVRNIVADQRASFEASKIRLESHIALTGVWVMGDAARITQILTNVLGNAEKFTPRGGTVFVNLQRFEQEAMLRVSDTGAGIEPDVLERVFEPFTQAPQTMDRARGGLGLGLSTVKGLVELLGGKVKMTSAGLGQGSELTITLPLTTPPHANPVRRQAPTPSKRRILVVEDNEDAADTLCAALTVIGHVVEVAYDGLDALEHARKFGPDVVFCDIGLPGLDGYDVARGFRADETLRDTYLVALSGYALPQDLQRALDAGFNRHVAKPPSMPQLIQLIAAAPRAVGPSSAFVEDPQTSNLS